MEHRGQLRHQHQLAELLRGVHRRPSRADGRAGGAELRLGRRGHGGGDRAGPRVCPPAHRRPGQLLGRPGAHGASHPAADRDRGRHPADRGRGDPELPPQRPDCHHPGRRPADDHRRPGGQPGGHQGARHQRRRLLQRELLAPVREPDRVDQLAGDLPAAGDQLLAAAHVRPHGRQRQAGLRDRIGHGDAVCDQRDVRCCGFSCSTTARCPPRPARRWRVSSSASASPTRRCSPIRPRSPPPVPSTRSTTPTPASAG